jgi:protein-S-isoprenylcysteine O-methyltransferase Ste14
MDTPLIAYVGFILLYRGVENAIMAKLGTRRRKPARDWTINLIAVPFFLVTLTPILEYALLERQPNTLTLLVGGIFFIIATALRAKGHLDLAQGFSMAIEEIEGQQLVTTGIYAHIRHPLYLGNLYYFIACPLFLASTYSWIISVIGIVGIFVRIPIEEKFLLETMPEYAEYREETAALLPGIY